MIDMYLSLMDKFPNKHLKEKIEEHWAFIKAFSSDFFKQAKIAFNLCEKLKFFILVFPMEKFIRTAL